MTKLRGLNCVAELFGIVPTEGNIGVPSVVEEFIGDANTFKASTLHAALKSSILSAAAMFRIALNIVNGLNNVHSRGVLHCDFKTDNIMLMPGFEHQRDPQIKIIDFGRAIRMDKKPKYEHYTPEKQQRVLTRSIHIAPEVVLGQQPHSVTSEVYSLGMVFLMMAGDQFKYLENAGEKCTDKNFVQRPTMDKIKAKLTSYNKRKQY